MTLGKISRAVLCMAIVAVIENFTSSSNAASIAVFADGGTNPAFGELVAGGHAPFYVTETDVAAGLANGADAFLYTRNEFSFGTYFGPAATAQIAATFTGNKVLHLTDITDIYTNVLYPGYADAVTLLLNSVGWATTGGKGFIGEFNGAGWALANGLFPGTDLLQGGYAYNPQVNVNPAHPAMAGIGGVFGYTNGADFLSFSAAIPASHILATDSVSGFVTHAATPVPEPATIVSFGLAIVGLVALRRSRRKN